MNKKQTFDIYFNGPDSYKDCVKTLHKHGFERIVTDHPEIATAAMNNGMSVVYSCFWDRRKHRFDIKLQEVEK